MFSLDYDLCECSKDGFRALTLKWLLVQSTSEIKKNAKKASTILKSEEYLSLVAISWCRQINLQMSLIFYNSHLLKLMWFACNLAPYCSENSREVIVSKGNLKYNLAIFELISLRISSICIFVTSECYFRWGETEHRFIFI